MLSKAENLIGRQLAGYRLLEPLGRGGMSLVFLAERLDPPQERVAIKVLMLSRLSTPEEFRSLQTRFLREAQTVHHLHHEHILPVLSYGEEDEILYMVMPLITGVTLAELLALKDGPLPFAEIAGYLNQLASAIDYAHRQGFLHRDIKPSNVLRDEQEKVYLVDFGIAHLFESSFSASDEAATALTTTGKLYGTPAYMAPERLRGEHAEPAADIYALGVLLYQLVTGQVPFKADSPLVVGMKHLNEMPLSPRSLRPDLPEPAEAAMLRALAKQPADRFATASALAAAFDAGSRGQWTAGLLPLPSLQAGSPDQVDTQEQQPAPLVPLPQGPLPAHQLMLGPAFPSVESEAPMADELTEANSSPLVQPRSRTRRGGRMLLLSGAILLAVALLVLLPVLGLQRLYSPPGTHKPVLPTSTSRMPTRTGVTPASTVGRTPTLSAQRTPTAGVTPASSPKTTPSPTPSPTLSPTPTPTPSSPPQPTPTPSPTPQSTP